MVVVTAMSMYGCSGEGKTEEKSDTSQEQKTDAQGATEGEDVQEESEQGESAKNYIKRTYKDNVLTKVSHYSEGEVVREECYDENGKLTTDSFYYEWSDSDDGKIKSTYKVLHTGGDFVLCQMENYDKDGRMLYNYNYNYYYQENEKVASIEYEYVFDENGKLVLEKKNCFGDETGAPTETRYQYDDNDRILKETNY